MQQYINGLSIQKLNRLFVYCLAAVWQVLLMEGAVAQSVKQEKPVSPLYVGANGRLAYGADAKGNRIPDFSYSGYMAAERSIPDVAIKVVVPVTKGDATARIQAALDYVASLPADKEGIRGAVLLEKGRYEVRGRLKINASGVVLRGSGKGSDGTWLVAAGTDRETLITIAGKDDRILGNPVRIADPYVPVNALKFRVADASPFKAGDQVTLHRPSTKEWIEALGTDHFGGGITALGWKPGQRDIFWDRTIVAVDKDVITIDAPLTTALDTAYGGGFISKYQWPGRISQVGVENLRLQSAYDAANPKDEAHCWMAITMEHVTDAWVRQVAFRHFAGSAVALFETARRVTVEDCHSAAPVSEIAGQRRFTFFTSGQQTLFQRNYAEHGYHDFAVGYMAAGPNAFVQCESYQPFSFSGAIDSWASGTLFDIVQVDGQALRFGNRGQDGQGAGWSAANSVFWQCSAARIDNEKPPTANNWAFGSWAQFSGNGYWEESNSHIKPRSLYYAQLSDRLGKEVMSRAFLLPVDGDGTSSPTVAQAAELTAQALRPAPQLSAWIDRASQRQPIPTGAYGIRRMEERKTVSPPGAPTAASMNVSNGWLVRGNSVVTGRRQEVPWWSGSSRPYALDKSKPHITRFVPGRTGQGLTDDLQELTDQMQQNHVVAMEHNYGLWYDRRRDDHERIRRMDGDVWPPFYELPFARSGKELAWDGLSKYDLTQYNTWYWNRLKKFADLADQKSLVLIHQNYFQHNIIEAGAHYADFPWRTANNINGTGFPEPVPYAGDKRIFMAEQFYDVSNPVRRKLHTAYIRKCLDNFKDHTGVIQLISAEYTGPLHFVQFWLDVIRQWEKETGKSQVIGLSTTKDVQDAILNDPARASVVDLIDIRYWHYQQDGSVYAPQGGQNLAPRQHARLLKPQKTSFEQVYRAVSEYRRKFPEKAVMYSGDSYDQFGWAVLMGGGSMAALPVLDKQFLEDAASMKPQADNSKKGQWTLQSKKGYIVYNDGSSPVWVAPSPGNYTVRLINTRTGQFIGEETEVAGGKSIEFKNPQQGAVVVWLRAKQKGKTV